MAPSIKGFCINGLCLSFVMVSCVHVVLRRVARIFFNNMVSFALRMDAHTIVPGFRGSIDRLPCAFCVANNFSAPAAFAACLVHRQSFAHLLSRRIMRAPRLKVSFGIVKIGRLRVVSGRIVRVSLPGEPA